MNAWFRMVTRQPGSQVTLFCFPFSGGGASAFYSWTRQVPPDIEVCPVQLPGRETRIREPAEISPDAIARAMADRIDLPYAVYGHSLGARLGFEVLRSLRALGVPPPVRFYPAASLPPDDPDTVAACVDLPDDEFLAVLIERLGAPTELRDVAELRQFQLPLLRHDLGWCHRYQYRPAPPLSTSIVAFAGVHDGVASPGKMAGWSRHGEHCRVEEVPGGHFFLRTASPHLTAMLTGDLHAALGVAAAGPGSI